MLHAAYADGQDPEEEVAKYVASYRTTPHTVTGQTPNKLMFNREISSKLPQWTTKSQAKHHREARRKDQQAKEKTKKYFDKKHRTRQEKIEKGDKVYRRNMTPTTTKGPWEPVPHQVTEVIHNRITGTRDREDSTRDRSDWKLVKERPEHLRYPATSFSGTLPTITEHVFEERDIWEDSPAEKPARYNTRAAARAPPPPVQRETPEDEAEEDQDNDNGDDGPAPPPRTGPNKNLCPRCHTLFKMLDGTRTCMHECFLRDDAFIPDEDVGALDIRDEQRQLYGTIAYVRGLENHPLRDQATVIQRMENTLAALGTMTAPEQESTTDEDTGLGQNQEPDDTDGSTTPEYNVLEEAPQSPQPGPSEQNQDQF